MDNRKGMNPYLGMRTSHEKSVQIDGKNQEFKMAALVDRQGLKTPMTPTALRKQLLSAFTTIPSNRPVAKVIRYSDNHSPTAIRTPGKTVLYRHKEMGVITTFTNHQTPKPATQWKDATALCQGGAEAVSIKDATGLTQKEMRLYVTAELLQAIAAEYKKNNSRRVISQNKVMVLSGVGEKHGSAKQYMKAMTIDSQYLCEWLHLIAHSMIGTKGQHVGNLAAGSKHGNTDMMFAEGQVHRLSAIYPQGFWVKAMVNLIEDTHIASCVQYTIETPAFSLPFVFNAHTPTKPHIRNHDYVAAVVTALLAPTSPSSSDAKEVLCSETPLVFKPERDPVCKRLSFDDMEEPISMLLDAKSAVHEAMKPASALALLSCTAALFAPKITHFVTKETTKRRLVFDDVPSLMRNAGLG